METRIQSFMIITLMFLTIILTMYWSDTRMIFHDWSKRPKTFDAEFLRSYTSRTVFYNRVEKCGSRSLTNVVRRLARMNNYNLVTSKNYDVNVTRSEINQEIIKIGNFPPRTFYQKHLHYVDFRKEGFEQPIYINLIRDPVERFASWHDYRKYGEDKSKFVLEDQPSISDCVITNHPTCTDNNRLSVIVRYFCGVDDFCQTNATSKEKVDLAKKHLDEEYLFVGITEEFDNSLLILEKLLPSYFTGALDYWKQHPETKTNTSTKKRDNITDEARAILKANLAGDYEIYNLAKAKFDYLKLKYGIV